MWLNKIKQAMATIGLKTVDIKIRSHVAPIVSEDEAAVRQRERINQLFIKQQNNLNTTALIPHAADCHDNWTCTRQPCFKWEPDKIVGKPVAMYGQQDSLEKIARLNEEINNRRWRR